MIVQFFEVVDQIMDALSVQEPANDLRWLRVVDGSQILLHCRVVVSLLIQEVAVLSEDDILLDLVGTKLLGQVDGVDVEIPLVENLQLLLEALLLISVQLFGGSVHRCTLSFSVDWTDLAVDRQQKELTPFYKDILDLSWQGFGVRNVLQVGVE